MIAFKYHDLSNIAKDPRGKGIELRNQDKAVASKIESNEASIVDVKKQISVLEQKHQNDDGTLKELGDQIQAKELEVFKMSEEIKSHEKEIQDFKNFRNQSEIKEAAIKAKVEKLKKGH